MLDDEPLVPGLLGREGEGQGEGLQSRSTVFESSKAGVEEDWRMVRKGIVNKQSSVDLEASLEEKGNSKCSLSLRLSVCLSVSLSKRVSATLDGVCMCVCCVCHV